MRKEQMPAKRKNNYRYQELNCWSDIPLSMSNKVVCLELLVL